MIAFAANSILTRMAVEPGHIDPISFALIRVLAGALCLCTLVLVNGAELPWRGKGRFVGAISLSAYMIGFSLAYISLDAGLGALILFGVVQITMFVYASVVGARPTARQITGAGVAFTGLVIALWPVPQDQPNVDFSGAASMVVAGLGWAAYTLSGKSSRNPLASTAANFALCLPILGVLILPFVDHVSVIGVALAVACGALTSGLGYALWYNVLPDLQQSVAAVVQLSVPIIAIGAGAVLLGEAVTLAVAVAALLVVSGIGLAATSRSVPADRSKGPPQG